MREVMEQLEYVLSELKDVARELQEVVGQIDTLTGDVPLDADTDQSTATSSSCSSGQGPAETHTHTHSHTLQHHLAHDTLVDCNWTTVSENPLPGSRNENCYLNSRSDSPILTSRTKNLLSSLTELRRAQPQVPPGGSAQVSVRNCFSPTPAASKGSCLAPNSPKGSCLVAHSPRSFSTPNSPRGSCSTPNSPRASCLAAHSLKRSCVTPNGPRTSCFIPGSPRGSFSSTVTVGSWGSLFGDHRDHRRLSQRELHALCCDDDDDDDDDEEVGGRSSGLHSSRLSSTDSVFSSSGLLALATQSPNQRRRMQRSCATQTVSDKSTQTAWPYVSPKRPQRN